MCHLQRDGSVALYGLEQILTQKLIIQLLLEPRRVNALHMPHAYVHRSS